MKALAIFDARIAAIHGLGGGEGDVMDVRHAEFIAMADAFLGPAYDREKLAQVESLQRELHIVHASLCKELAAHQIAPDRYVDEVNHIHFSIAQQCEAVLGQSDFFKLFGVTPAELRKHIDKEVFLEQI